VSSSSGIGRSATSPTNGFREAFSKAAQDTPSDRIVPRQEMHGWANGFRPNRDDAGAIDA
jgi:hypothetical protein